MVNGGTGIGGIKNQHIVLSLYRFVISIDHKYTFRYIRVRENQFN